MQRQLHLEILASGSETGDSAIFNNQCSELLGMTCN